MESIAVNLMPPPDGRQSQTALAVARGTSRWLGSLGFSCISELPLPSGRRADLVALNGRGDLWIVEIKSSVEDLRADHKWQDYRAHCDRLFFAFPQDLPCEIFPAEAGLIVADAYGAHLHCEAPEHRLPAPTRKLMTVRFGMAAAQRINRLIDPQGCTFDDLVKAPRQRGARFARMRCKVRRCMLSRRAVSETLRLQSS